MPNDKHIQHLDGSVPFRRVLAASSLAGDSVKNKHGEELGSIIEIMIDLPSGRVAYAVLSFGGFLGIGNKLFALPWGMLTVDEDQKCFILDVNRTTLRTLQDLIRSSGRTWPIRGGVWKFTPITGASRTGSSRVRKKVILAGDPTFGASAPYMKDGGFISASSLPSGEIRARSRRLGSVVFPCLV